MSNFDPQAVRDFVTRHIPSARAIQTSGGDWLIILTPPFDSAREAVIASAADEQSAWLMAANNAAKELPRAVTVRKTFTVTLEAMLPTNEPPAGWEREEVEAKLAKDCTSKLGELLGQLECRLTPAIDHAGRFVRMASFELGGDDQLSQLQHLRQKKADAEYLADRLLHFLGGPDAAELREHANRLLGRE